MSRSNVSTAVLFTPAGQTEESAPDLSVLGAVRAGWEAFREAIPFYALLGLIMLVVLTALSYLAMIIIGIPLLWIFGAGVTVTGLHLIRRDAALTSPFCGFPKFLPVLGAAALITLLIGMVILIFALPYWLFGMMDAGTGRTILLIFSFIILVAGVLAAVWLQGRLLLTFPLIIEQDSGIIDALKTSWHQTATAQWKLVGALLLIGLVIDAGLLLCGIGIILSFPLGLAMQGSCIDQLLEGGSGDAGTGSALNINDPKPVIQYD
ncbi:MAG: glycerophosphoryl diester phosphodiesterase membrane domain-containing protein [Leptospiraceae bacterium]|nr:glycerophosphoryl diester phosphodiesterase membrane domain-containing protein [Leptospiraceae bacterium]